MTVAATQAAPAEPIASLTMDAVQAAKLIGISNTHFWAMLSSGRIPPGFRLGRRRLWAVDDLRAWIAAGAPTADRWAAIKKDL
jgi:excisionase family DNA binding protein